MSVKDFYQIYEPIKLNHEFMANLITNETKEKEVCSICLDNQVDVVLPSCLVIELPAQFLRQMHGGLERKGRELPNMQRGI